MRRYLQGIDHVVIVVRDLDKAQRTYARMGFTLTPRGFHTLGSQNHCLMFGSDYMELLAVPVHHPANRHYSEFLRRGEGLAGLAFATDDAAGLRSGLAAEGIAAGEPLDFSRPVEGLGEARFRIVQFPPEAAPGLHAFACQHFTRELVWRPEYQRHANGAVGLAALAVVAEDPPAAAASYANLVGQPPQRIAEGLLLACDPAPIAVVSRGRLGRRLHGVALPPRPRPVAAALFVRVADRAATASMLRRNGLAPIALADGSFAIGADAAHGVAVVFG
jgi:catechol 2,3-dioxygenase-like lactoylglutathione lyase family enzyme